MSSRGGYRAYHLIPHDKSVSIKFFSLTLSVFLFFRRFRIADVESKHFVVRPEFFTNRSPAPFNSNH